VELRGPYHIPISTFNSLLLTEIHKALELRGVEGWELELL
jgi:hypothetical protein